MVKQRVIAEKQKSSYIEDLVFDSANRFKSVMQPLGEANKYKGMLQKVAPQLFESSRFQEERRLRVPIVPIDDAPGGMVPIGDSGWYVTPEEPAAPDDCERYPDSLLCGGIPFDFKRFKLEFSFVVDTCNLGIKVTPVFFYFKLPPIAIAYRHPSCRNLPLPQAPVGNAVPFPPTVCAVNALIATVFYQNSYISTDDFYFQRNRDFSDPSHPYYNFPDRQCSFKYTEVVELVDYEIPYKGTPPPDLASFKYDFLIYLRFKHSITFEADNEFVSFALKQNPNSSASDYNASIEFYQEHYIPNRLNYSSYEEYSFSSISPNYNPKAGSGIVYIDTIANAKRKIGTKYNEYYYEPEPLQSFYFDLVNRFEGNEKKYKIEILCSKLANNNPPPPIPPPKPPEMNCCNLVAALVKKVDNLSIKVNDLTKTVGVYEDKTKSLAKVTDKLSEVVGVDEYPASLPKSLISKDQGWLGNLIPNADVSIPNLTRLLSWYIERFDEIMGQFEIPIEIVDSDPTTPGNQPKGLKLPNVAESIAEIVTLLLQCSINSETLVSVTTRALIETGQDKQQNFATYMLLMALADYVGFDYKEKKVTLPMLFTPGKEDLDELLQETDITVNVAEYNEKFNLQADLIRFRKAASILDAVFFKKVDPSKDIKKQIIDEVKANRALVKKTSKTDESDFTDFIDDITQFYKSPPATP